MSTNVLALLFVAALVLFYAFVGPVVITRGLHGLMAREPMSWGTALMCGVIAGMLELMLGCGIGLIAPSVWWVSVAIHVAAWTGTLIAMADLAPVEALILSAGASLATLVISGVLTFVGVFLLMSTAIVTS
ncbi:MAG: hypothetical protein H6734_28335 [Alphaproteobacteria bacterium]|nr:hypothetical protein [Alphaproteobacteria bacterium]MCB9684301.1 hypothetical protein [Alphaproteobacteria bacterium]